jgi:hypothetical protein
MNTETPTPTTTPTPSTVEGPAGGPLLTREILAFVTFAYRAAVVGLLAYIAVSINSGVRALGTGIDGKPSYIIPVMVENYSVPVYDKR